MMTTKVWASPRRRLGHRLRGALRLAMAIALTIGSAVAAPAQPPPIGIIAGYVTDLEGGRVPAATVTLGGLGARVLRTVYSDHTGSFHFPGLVAGRYEIVVTKDGFVTSREDVDLRESERRDLVVSLKIGHVYDSVTVLGDGTTWTDEFNGVARMGVIDDTAIYGGKKNEVLVLDRMDANLALGNTRQVFAKVPGTNLWEIDASGLQVGISNRGLDPNRSWEMNSRQNGYDITADIFGYPEAYFTPPLEAVERIEVVRGSASLQYGAQFGGLVNYVLKHAPGNRRFTLTTEQTTGTEGLFNSHNRIGGRLGSLTYNAYYHRRQGDGWRDNAGFDSDTAFGSLRYDANERLSIDMQFTGNRYLLQMAGGLTDALFQQDPRMSVRPRNFFHLRWLLPAIKAQYTVDPTTRVSVNVYGLNGQRFSLFNSEPIALANGDLNVDDPSRPRTLYNDRFHNFGTEVRLLKHYTWRGQSHSIATGVRAYRGKTVRQQGLGRTGLEPEFTWLNPDPERDLHFKNINFAGFAETMLHVTPRFTVTPGVRFDHVDSVANGRPIVGTMTRTRAIPLFGVGLAYQTSPGTSVYGNITQAYRATLFNDYWRPDPTIVVDQEMRDMLGHVAEFGWRGTAGRWLSFDVGGFSLTYRNRLGLLNTQDANGRTTVLWTNVADSRNIGLESFVETDLVRAVRGSSAPMSLSVFSSTALFHTRYLDGPVRGNRVEIAPNAIVRTGITYATAGLSATLQHSYTGDQFTNANNTLFTVDGSQGLIPSYAVWDMSGSYRLSRRFVLRAGVNNLANAKYFTRRATSYPGPGLVPADGRRVQVSAGVTY